MIFAAVHESGWHEVWVPLRSAYDCSRRNTGPDAFWAAHDPGCVHIKPSTRTVSDPHDPLRTQSSIWLWLAGRFSVESAIYLSTPDAGEPMRGAKIRRLQR